MKKINPKTLLNLIFNLSFWKILVFSSLFLLSSFPSFSQQIERDVISSIGGSFNNDLFDIDWTVGEIATKSELGSPFIFIEGFHQPTEGNITALVSVKTHSLEFKIYPNPTEEIINIEIESNDLNVILDCRLLNSLGQVLKQKKLEKFEHQMRIGDLPQGIYFFQIISSNNLLHTTKINKI